MPTGEDSTFSFLASPDATKTYTFDVRQTYSDGSVVDWSGPESSDTPAPTIEAKSSLGGGGSSTLALIALIVGAVGVAGRDPRTRRRREALARVRRRGAHRGVVAAALALPASAFAHAALLRTVPQASGTVNTPPHQVALTYSEAVEPRFAIVSVTDAAGRQQTAGPPRRSPANADTLLVPLKRVGEGWYLVYWRAISVDGHPVRGAFTFAVGPNPGPAPQFVIPSTSETAATPRLIVARWLVFLSVMAAIGLLALRLAIARPVIRRVRGTSLRNVSIAFFVARRSSVSSRSRSTSCSRRRTSRSARCSRSARSSRSCASRRSAAATSTSSCASRSSSQRARSRSGSTGPNGSNARSPSCSRSRVRRRPRARRCSYRVPRVIRRRPAPRGLALPLDWLHLASGSLWIGGLAGLLVLWRSLPAAKRVAGLVVAVPRFSNVALGVGARAGRHPARWRRISTCRRSPVLWQTSYGQAILVKVALLLVAVALASVNLLRTKPGLRTEANRRSATAAATRRRGSRDRRGGNLRGRDPLLARSALQGTRLGRERQRARRPGAGECRRAEERLPPRASASPRTAPPCPTTSPSRSVAAAGRCADATVIQRVTMLDMEMGSQEYRLRGDCTRCLHVLRTGARDGRALGPLLRGHTARLDATLRRPGRRPRDRMNANLRLLASLLALAAGATAVVVVILLLRSVLG